MADKKHAKAIRRREKLKARKKEQEVVARASGIKSRGNIFGTDEFLQRFGDVSPESIASFSAAQLGRQEVTIEQLPEDLRERFQAEATRIEAEHGTRVRFYKKPNGEYSMMF